MNTEARLGENTKFTVVGDGNGFMSRVILVEPDWTVHGEHLPNRFVLKITSCMHVLNVLDQMNLQDKSESALWSIFEYEAQGLHNREVNLYEIIGKWNMDDVLMSPKVFFSKKFDSENLTKGFFAMEYVDNAITRHLYINLKSYELHSILKSLAVFQAESLKLNKREQESVTGYDLEKIVGKMFSQNGLNSIFEQVRQINKEELSEAADKIAVFGVELVNFDLVKNLNNYLGIKKNVLVHGDLWSANIMWKENKDEFRVDKIIDYQSIHLGNPAEDLVRLFISTLSGSERQKYWEKLLEQFYEYFIEALEDKNVPYTLEQLKESYRLYFVTGSLLMLPMFGPIAEVKLAEMSDPDEVKKYREILTEKTKRLLNDMEHRHLYTREIIKKWK
ncbi:CHK kinase-like domain-containing protein [Caenorhabditis elegans]|uniref:CHK kinase-like domain-containing protein n=1 Tax=Caenorhabditis elegans TaxID=6239 RepID=Q9XUP6_CAEEL|nr:CHK kinase-like domain-containing protein [Caenorhabditis elegans]CAB04729.2 CHK kinase-like domain-containing protein [Caenorhabditis elegans]|eukprot:NP_506237.2 Uncharacterized protein CELE_T16G1.3 [Caenorhabditis elegans]